MLGVTVLIKLAVNSQQRADDAVIQLAHSSIDKQTTNQQKIPFENC